jgi:hypothetical protein
VGVAVDVGDGLLVGVGLGDAGVVTVGVVGAALVVGAGVAGGAVRRSSSPVHPLAATTASTTLERSRARATAMGECYVHP